MMLRPSYMDLINAVNKDTKPGEEPIVHSRYTIVIATAKRARQLVDGDEPLIEVTSPDEKPLSIAVDELYRGAVKIVKTNEDE